MIFYTIMLNRFLLRFFSRINIFLIKSKLIIEFFIFIKFDWIEFVKMSVIKKYEKIFRWT